MMLLIRIVAGLHLAAYLGIMWYGWKSYKLLRKKSWQYMGIGFFVLLLYRTRQFIEQLIGTESIEKERLIPFIGAVFLLVAFRMLYLEHHKLISKLAVDPGPSRAGAQSVEYWTRMAEQQAAKTLESIRQVVREEIAAASGTTTVTVKGPSSIVTEPIVETPP